MKSKWTKNLIEFMKVGTSSFLCVENIKKILKEKNYQELYESEPWNLIEGNYFVTRNDASIIAFQIKKNRKDAFSIVTSHLDTPSLLLKPNGAFVKEDYLKYNVMPYGGLLNYGWLDRPLSLSGRVILQKKNTFFKKMIDLKDTMLVIPSVAIHLNDKANSNLDLNMQKDLQPILSLTEKKDTWNKLIKSKLNLNKDETLWDYDLFCYHNTEPVIFGYQKELLLSPRIDNLTSVYSSLEAFLECKSKTIPIFCSFNNEEIGSLTKEGADSNFLLDILKRIASSIDIDITTTLSKSFIISSDNTHAIHPNHPEYSDDTGIAKMGQGLTIIKEISSTTDSYFSSILKSLCKKENIPYQDSTLKNDIAGGSTLSGISLRHVSVTSIDVGICELAMHSSMELCSIEDIYSLYRLFLSFYNSFFEIKKETTISS